MRLAGRVVVITGAGRGLGRAYATAFAAEGAAIVVAEIDEDAGRATAGLISSAGGRSLSIATDVTSVGSVDEMVAGTLEAFGRIDVLVNNAAIYDGIRCAPVEALTVDEWERVLSVNVRGVWNCVRAVVPAMKREGSGKIVNVASGTVLSGTPYMLHYVASKGAIVAMSRSLARELGPSGITVNTLVPGLTDSGAQKVWDVPDGAPQARPIPSLERRLTPDALVGAAIFLASSDSDLMTGQLLVINGGTTFV
jgi:NAD(P)-dependent dehydrogenase (short-subunit alcohol dehydrogenase family)